METPSVKKLKQAQLPLLLNKGSPSAKKISKAEKENASTASAALSEDAKDRKKRTSQECMVIDLTNSDIAEKDKNVSAESLETDRKASKKRRKRTSSPITPNSKRSAVSGRDANPSTKSVPKSKPGTLQKTPKIMVTPATPKSGLIGYFKPLERKATEKSVEPKSKPDVLTQMESERVKAANKEKHRHAPLASILRRKRSRSKSPPKLTDASADEGCVGKAKKSDMDEKKGDKDTEEEVAVYLDDSDVRDETDKDNKGSMPEPAAKDDTKSGVPSQCPGEEAQPENPQIGASGLTQTVSVDEPINSNSEAESNEGNDIAAASASDINISNASSADGVDNDVSDHVKAPVVPSEPCIAIVSDDEKLEGDPVVVIDSMDDVGTSPKIALRKSPRRVRAAKKPASVEDSKPKSKSRRSLEAERRKEEKERDREEKRQQREQLKTEKERERMELLKKKEEEKARKEEERRKKKEEEEAAKAERLRIKEEERRKKKEEEEAAKAEKLRKLEERKKERERLEAEKKLERERKEEEKRKEREKKELERLQAEKEKQQAEEEKRKKNEKRAEAFKNFFRSPDKAASVKKTPERIGIFVPFQPKQDMFLAPIHRRKLSPRRRTAFEDAFSGQDSVSDYLKEVAGKPKFFFGPTIPKTRKKFVSLEDDGLELVDDGVSSQAEVLRAKFLSFHTNYRPPYFGTWRKKSNVLSYKDPFKKDSDLFDYEFDSDDEWEEPADGEDIDNSEGEDEGEGNEEDEDDGFFVPHGYLSDDEGIGEEGEEIVQKPDHKLKQKQLEFEASFKRKLTKLTPLVIGCVWKDSASAIDKVHRDLLDSYKPIFLCKTPIPVTSSNGADNERDSPADAKPEKNKTKHSVPEEAMPDLIRLLHGNPLSLSRIVNEFQTYWRVKNTDASAEVGPISLDDCMEQDVEIGESADAQPEPMIVGKPSTEKGIGATPTSKNGDFEISKTQIRNKCKEIATYERKSNMNRSCWFVRDTVLAGYDFGRDGVPVPCRWKYATEVPKVQLLVFPEVKKAAAAEKPPAPGTPKPNPAASIAKFASKVSPKAILESSKLKHEKVKITHQQSRACSISKFATEKNSPDDIIEKSAQKICEENRLKAKEAAKVKPTVPPPPQEGVTVIPSKEAIQSFFKMDSKKLGEKSTGE